MRNSIQSQMTTPDSRTQLLADSEGNLKAWDIHKKQIHTDGRVHKKPIVSMQLSQDGKFLFTSSFDQSIKLQNIKDEDLIKDFDKIHEDSIHSIHLVNE